MKVWFVLLCILVNSFLYAQTMRVFLLGDAGEPTLPTDQNLHFLAQKLDEASANDVLLILGDNLYPKGLPPAEHPQRADAEKKINVQLDLIKKFKGRSFITPGNHDWNEGKKNGYDWILNMQHYVEEYLGNSTVFIPQGGCPGPVEIPLTEEILLVVINTQYYLHPWSKPEQESACEEKSTYESLMELTEVIKRNANKHIIVAGHHTIYSHGQHGGHYTFKQHIFPLTDWNKKLYVPLPVLGSIYPIFRTVIGSRQDMSHPRYRLLRKNMQAAFTANENLVYVSGHEHSLQYIKSENKHYIVSGSGSKSSPVKKGKNSIFSHEGLGFATLIYEQGKNVSVQFWDGPNGKLITETKLYEKDVKPVPSVLTQFNFEDSTVFRPISTQYGASALQKKILGANYRELWATPVEIPVFNLGKEHGGLTVKKVGGGNQTKSMRLEAPDGKQYVLRSLDKYTEKLLPPALRKTLAANILQDEISAANPYGAFAVPPMAEALGIYHTNPKMVFIPNDPRFGQYQDVFAGLVAVYEERPTNEFASASFFGGGEKILSTAELLEKLHSDNDHLVDQPFTLRSRLFDNFLADWDRHDDQWRWVRTSTDNEKVYRPIPRDRDQAFYVNNGLLPWIASRKWAMPNFDGFQDKIQYPAGFNTSGRFFDRSFLNSLDWSDWEKEIENFQSKLTDQAIETAFKDWPKSIQDQAATRTISILKNRRDNLFTSARSHYLFLAQEVEVVGTDKHELFTVERLSDKETLVTVTKRTKEGQPGHILYKRLFKTEETGEIRLYGLGGEDVFTITGHVNKGSRVRIIGGSDKDKIIDSSFVKGSSHKTVAYDLKKNTTVESGKELSLKLSTDVKINEYNRTAFKYNKLIPLASVQYNPDDGIFLGGGFHFTKHGWRKEPFAQQHKLSGNVALATGAFNFHYSGTFTNAIGKWSLSNSLTVQSPFAVSNYFGMGNESVFDVSGENIPGKTDDAIDYYRIRFQRINIYSAFSRGVGQKSIIKIGPEYLAYKLQKNTDRFITSPQSDLNQTHIFNEFNYLGGRASWKTDTRNNDQLPEKGINTEINFSQYEGLNSESKSFAQLSGEFSFYLTAQIPLKLTLANRVGGVTTSGNPEFFNGATLGKEALRGYRRTRFIGKDAFYHNLDLRLKLASFRTYILPGSVGILAFHDVGRVWLDNEKSNKWHKSIGGGIWISPINKWALAFNMAFTEEENLPSVSLGFHF